MKKEEVVRSAINFYEIPKQLKRKITNIAIRRIEELQISRTDDIYTCVSDLVDKFLITPPYEERFFTRLDHPRYDDSRTLENELFWGLEQFNENPNTDNKGISVKEVYEILSPSLDKYIKKLFERIMIKCKKDYFPLLSQEYLTRNIGQIVGKLEKLLAHNEKEIITPNRTIQIRFNPLTIWWLERNPDGRFKGISQEKQEILFEAFEKNRIVRLAAKEAGISTATGAKYLRKNNYALRPVGFKANEIPIQKKLLIIREHERCNNATRVGKKFNVSKGTTLRIWRNKNLLTLKQGGRRTRKNF